MGSLENLGKEGVDWDEQGADGLGVDLMTSADICASVGDGVKTRWFSSCITGLPRSEGEWEGGGSHRECRPGPKNVVCWMVAISTGSKRIDDPSGGC